MGIQPATNQDIENLSERVNRNIAQVAQHNNHILRLSTSLGRISGIVQNSFRTADEKHFNSSQKITELEFKIEELADKIKCSFILHAIYIIAYITTIIAIIYIFHRISMVQQMIKT